MFDFSSRVRILSAALIAASLGPAAPAIALAEDATTVNVMLKDHQFTPSEIHVPANKPVVLLVQNADGTAEEFDSPALKAEKVIAPGQTATIRIRPLAAGSYPFVGEFHEDSAKGVVVAE